MRGCWGQKGELWGPFDGCYLAEAASCRFLDKLCRVVREEALDVVGWPAVLFLARSDSPPLW